MADFGIDVESRVCDDALDDEGYVMTLLSTGNVKKATGVLGEPVYGIANKHTKHPRTDAARTGISVGILKRPKISYVQYNNGAGETIAVGNLVSVLGCNAAGTVKKHAATAHVTPLVVATEETIDDEFGLLVGVALEAKAENTSGKLKTLLICPQAWKQ